MGNSDSSFMCAPPGGSLLVVQAADICPTTKFAFEHTRPRCVPDACDGAWRSFEAKVKSCVSRMWTEKLSFLLALSLFAILIITAVAATMSSSLMIGGSPVIAFIPPVWFVIWIGGMLGARWFIVSTNRKIDKEILAACNTLASATGLHVEYRTRWTGFVATKNARTFRGIAIAPGAAIGAAQVASGTEVVSCVVPPGAGPGSVIKVVMPSGATVQATVPAGKIAGDTLQVYNRVAPAAPVVVEAVVV
eukprot:TRINITY_DN17425_c0_g4_i1.p1 TRINITY_DN17425_c0_g4~~TRINITY_DN17425_c0_g4_i1.p1  ORF type:complete len:248 (+),score=32.08 TRINITY_DN17425_c0_g4_i1:71-814(+)